MGNKSAILGSSILRQLFQLDLAVDSGEGKPNPKIYDIEISWYDVDGNEHGPQKAHEARLSKLLARFEPPDNLWDPTTTGYWVQRNAENLSLFALSTYLRDQLGNYPRFPIVFDKLKDLEFPVYWAEMVGFEADHESEVPLILESSDTHVYNDEGVGAG